MKQIFFLLALFTSLTVYCQDVIVKRDGSTIISKVLEVNTADIKYKKFSNQNGPTYTINISDVMVINYENGEKDTFNSTSNTTPTSSTIAASPASTPVVDYAALAEDNLPFIREFNSHDVKYLDTDAGKKAGAMICTLGIKEGSIVETPELKASFTMKREISTIAFFSGNVKSTRIADITDKGGTSEQLGSYMLAVTLKNKTNKTIYIDLGTSYLISGEESKPYYIPTSTTTSTGSTSGGSVSLGSIVGGVTVGGASSSSTSKTIFSQRVISIPPMASVSLAPKGITGIFDKSYYNYFDEKGMITKKKSYDILRIEGLKRGEKIDIPQIKDITPLSVYISYASDEMMKNPQNMRIDFYLRQILGIQKFDLNPWDSIDYSKCPLILYYQNSIYL